MGGPARNAGPKGHADSWAPAYRLPGRRGLADFHDGAAAGTAVGIHVLIPRILYLAVAVHDVVVAELTRRQILDRHPHPAAVAQHALGLPVIKLADQLHALGPAVLVLEEHIADGRPPGLAVPFRDLR